MINQQLEAVVAQFNPDAATDAEKWHCDVNATAVETMTEGVLPENIVGLLEHDAALLKTLRNVLDDDPKVSKAMRDKLKGTENPFEHCVSQVAIKHFIEAWAGIAKDMSFMGTKNKAGYSNSVLEQAEINSACLKKLAACAWGPQPRTQLQGVGEIHE